ncbi:MAG: enoyl-[acyl-carrier-protein] reductase FabL [Dehalococcoidia bacterium]|nr:enoyl-[acyl-carrier-protein] reductase FabL [Dehalococcoidia bacterium]
MDGGDREFEGKVALITGASRGIGRAIALEFARRGSNIAFNYMRSHEAAADTERAVLELGVDCLRVKAQVGDLEKIGMLFEAITERYGRLDILINNAASGVQRAAVDLDPKHWDWTMAVNARAPWLCAVEASRLMSSGGSIVNISSMGSVRVLPHYFSVGVSKAALEAVTRYLAVELAPMGIRVNGVSGGYVETGAFDSFPNRDQMMMAAEQTVTGRPLTPEDIAAAVAFLCSRQAEMIRGQVVVVDGGVTLRA